ncbi:MAG: glycoside hydrolase family 2, partial [Oscillospiraceae bacterium]|nr:glycoside hydrolase family 2 [Oscillospiraceae bacterium]
GGYSCKLPEHSFNLDKTYGYKKCDGVITLQIDIEKLYRNEIIPAINNGLSAAVLTQVSDVEDETNGLVTYDRRVTKVNADGMAALSAELHAAFAKKTK